MELSAEEAKRNPELSNGSLDAAEQVCAGCDVLTYMCVGVCSHTRVSVLFNATFESLLIHMRVFTCLCFNAASLVHPSVDAALAYTH